MRAIPGTSATRHSLKGYTAAILDLDGTIADSAPGVIGSIVVAFERAGLEPPPRSELVAWLGPPMIASLRAEASLDEATAQRVLAEYRAHYDSVGVFDASLYDGMLKVLDTLTEAGIPLAIATSKPQGPALALLEHLGIADRFAVIFGASDAHNRRSKRDVLEAGIDALAVSHGVGGVPVMVGDRHHDIGAAQELGVPAVFAAWGYGSADESRGATATAAAPPDLIPLVLGA